MLVPCAVRSRQMRPAAAPEQNEFYELLSAAGTNALAAAELIERRFREFPDTAIDQERVEELEHEGDRLTAEIFRRLNLRLPTPVDREDVYDLARAIDDIVDYIEEASDLLGLYKVEAPTEQALAQCRVLVGAASELAASLNELPSLAGIESRLEAIKRYEDEGDRIARDAIAALFEDEEVDPRLIIRWKDIVDALEQAIDACDTTAHVIGNVVVKNP
jgi:predicted phosphate transport protein (TIGR00153 family)